jgi:hypothetical protein
VKEYCALIGQNFHACFIRAVIGLTSQYWQVVCFFRPNSCSVPNTVMRPSIKMRNSDSSRRDIYICATSSMTTHAWECIMLYYAIHYNALHNALLFRQGKTPQAFSRQPIRTRIKHARLSYIQLLRRGPVGVAWLVELRTLNKKFRVRVHPYVGRGYRNKA